jgi:Raf kinase inhibitor-like YbhB/YbcL family protein
MCNLYSVTKGQVDVRTIFRTEHGTRNVTRAKPFAAAIVVATATCANADEALTLTSADVVQGGRIAEEQVFNGGGCAGKNVSPELAWFGAPRGTKSFAVSMLDPDTGGGFLRWAKGIVLGMVNPEAPTRAGFRHWWVVNVPGETTMLPEDAGSGKGLPAGAVQLRNDFGAIGYGGPCPPRGKPHHYQFTVYALDVNALELDQNSSAATVDSKVRQHTLAKAMLWGLYER